MLLKRPIRLGWTRPRPAVVVAALFVASLLSVSVPRSVAASTILHVPGDYPTIQAAIDAAVAGDTVLVDPGTYVETINFRGKAITVKSAYGPKVTFIDGNRRGSVVTFDSREGP